MRTVLHMGTVLVLLAVSATAAGQTVEELYQKVQQQQRQLDQQAEALASLRTQVGQTWMDQRRREQVRDLVADVLADADTRASLLDDGVVAGHNGANFFLASNDGAFLLKIMGQIQTRYLINLQDDSGDDDGEQGFENTRTRFGFKGHVLDPSWEYFIWTGHNSSGTYLPLDVWIQKTLDNGIAIKVGAFKVPVWKEWLVSETRLQAVERSLLTARFAGSYTEGVAITYGMDNVHLLVSFNDGAGARVTPALGSAARVEGLGATGRAEILLAGNWKQFADLEGWRDGEFGWVVGGAVHYQQGEYGATDDEAQTTFWSVDTEIEFQGANLFVAFLGNHVSDVEAVDDMDQYGLLIQGGVFVTEKIELFARYEWGDLDMADVENLSIVTIGGNYFVAGHRVKLSMDVGYSFNKMEDEWDYAGYQVDASDQDGQVLIRTQAQLLF